MTPSNLIAAARDLLAANRGRPRQANLCRAVSTTYYALFHCLAGCCADSLVGKTAFNRGDFAWDQVYRSLEHRTARRRCQQVSAVRSYPEEIRNFADLFVDLQEKRHRADYDPRVSFAKFIVLRDIYRAEEAITTLHNLPSGVRKSFAIYVLLTVRNQ